jgi:hypothetical protein
MKLQVRVKGRPETWNPPGDSELHGGGTALRSYELLPLFCGLKMGETTMPGKLNLRAMLAVGRHSLDKGRVCEVVELIARQPRRIGSVVECLWDEDAGVACRAADVLERLTRGPESRLAPHLGDRRIGPRALDRWKDSLIGLLGEAEPRKLRWNLAFVIPRLELTVAEARRAAATLNTFLDDSSSIVKTAAMHGLADLARHDPAMLPGVVDLLRVLSRSGTPAMRARGRILLKETAKRDGWRGGGHSSG